MEKSNRSVTWVAAFWNLMLNCVTPHQKHIIESDRNKTSISSLDNELIVEILSRLPAQTVLACKPVCSSWDRLINTTQFAETHLSRATPVILVRASNFKKSKDVWFFIDDFSLEPRFNKVRVNECDMIIRRFDNSELKVYCNGLLIFADAEVEDRYVICNPVTREVLAFRLRKYDIICGFYFHELEKEYKLLIYQEDDIDKYSVYGLSTKVRRITPGISKDISTCYPGVAAYGALFWWYDSKIDDTNRENCIIVDTYNIVMFNFDTESFVEKPQPSDRYKCEGRADINLFEIEGKLWWCDVYAKSVHVWILEDIATWKWVKRYVVDLNGHINDCDAENSVILGIQNGNMLFRSYRGLWWWNLGRKKVIKINTGNVNLHWSSVFVQGIQYKSNMVSLGNSNILPYTS